MPRGAQIIQNWPMESREAAELVLKSHGEPDEATESQLLWHNRAPWKRIVAMKSFYPHNFPRPHIDCIESFIDYRVPAEKFDEIAAFDGSVICERTAGEVSARCHDLEANFLALNLMHDIVTGRKTVRQARDYYGKEVLDCQRGKSTPYMKKLHFVLAQPAAAADPDVRTISDDELKRAAQEGTAHA